jgi:iron(III) transport system permease protein
MPPNGTVSVDTKGQDTMTVATMPPPADLEKSRFGAVTSVLRRPTVVATTLVGLVVGWLALAPLGVLLWDTLWDGNSLSLSRVTDAYSAYGIGNLVKNSFLFALGTTLYAVVQGGVLAYLAARTNAPFKSLLFASSLVPLITPGVLSTIAWIYIGSPKVGLVNNWLEPLFGAGTLNVFSLPGMIFVEGQHLAPLVFLLMFAAFKSMDPSLEESALMSGAKRRTVIRRITLPMAAPAIYASIVIMMVRSLEAFEVPALIGLPNGITVFTGRIWRALSDYPLDKSTAGAYSLGLLVLTAIGMWAYTKLTRRSQKAYQTVTGKGFRSSHMDLGRARKPIGIAIIVYFLVAVVLPLFILLYGSTQSFYSPPTWDTMSHPTMANYRAIFSDDTIVRSLRNSIVLSVTTATAVAFIMAVASWIVIRTKIRGRAIVSFLSSVPLAIPGIVLGFALLTVYLWVPIPVYGTMWILFIAYFTRFMPYGLQYAATSMIQIGAELEESARMSGANWWQVFRRILIPLILPGLVAGWIYVVTVSLRELSASLLLYSPGNEVLSITIWDLWANGRFPAVAAVGVVMILVLLLIIGAARKITSRFGIAQI